MMQETSLAAYRSEVEPTLSERQSLVFAALGKAGPMTNCELAEYLGWRINTVTPRTNELVKIGRATRDCQRPCRITGRTAIAWRAVHKDTLF